MGLMAQFVDRIGIMYGGRLVETAPTDRLLSAPEHPYTQGLLASFPSVSGPRKTLTGIGGSPPNMKNPPSGCCFHPRCSQAIAECSETSPRLETLGPNHRGACHLLTPAARSLV